MSRRGERRAQVAGTSLDGADGLPGQGLRREQEESRKRPVEHRARTGLPECRTCRVLSQQTGGNLAGLDHRYPERISRGTFKIS